MSVIVSIPLERREIQEAEEARASSKTKTVRRHTRSAGGFKNRCRIEIVASLLNAASSAALKTHLMYSTNLSYMVMSKYLEHLRAQGLVEELPPPLGSGSTMTSSIWKITEKGVRFLSLFRALGELTDTAAATAEHVDPENSSSSSSISRGNERTQPTFEW